jgi:hypothetical protein
MKNVFKFGFLALAISLSVAACNSGQTSEGAADSDSIAAAATDSIDSTAAATIDTVDSAASAAKDSVAGN